MVPERTSRLTKIIAAHSSNASIYLTIDTPVKHLIYHWIDIALKYNVNIYILSTFYPLNIRNPLTYIFVNSTQYFFGVCNMYYQPSQVHEQTRWSG